jgi:hypothetical protein
MPLTQIAAYGASAMDAELRVFGNTMWGLFELGRLRLMGNVRFTALHFCGFT